MKYAAACIHIKNEQDIINEWLAFHRAVGFEHLFVIDNGSDDNTARIVKNFSDRDSVTYLFQPTGNPAEFSTTFIKSFGDQFRWMAFIDADEFLYPASGGDIRAVLAEYESFAGVGVYWQIYGSNGHESKPEGLTIETMTQRAPSNYYLNRHIKSIVDPRKVFHPLGSHMFKLAGDCVDEQRRVFHDGPPHGYFEDMEPSHNVLRINHYHVRAREQYVKKAERGYFGIDDQKLRKSDDRFKMMWDLHDKNDEFDDSATSYKKLMDFYL
ncbi:MAG: glycosyltransferase family 2 protein [Methylobacterium frigidaeris]